jgi:eukaryotic-like serine/threonine-protein kinase
MTPPPAQPASREQDRASRLTSAEAPRTVGRDGRGGVLDPLRVVLATFAGVTAAAPALPPCPHCGHDHPDTKLKCPDTDMILPLEGRLLDGKFRLIKRLGRGGMASVWLARNIRVDKQVALKLIRPEVLRSEDMVARFRSEAKAAGRIDHPNICEILDYGVGPVGPYIVLEYLRGRNLAEIIRQDGPLPVPMAVMILRHTLAALEAVHEQGIVHRDLKPENVFLHKPPGGEPIVKLMDFGVAKLTDGSAEVETEHGALLGTPEYMAPEQFKGASNADRRTDVWGIGAIAYRALTGKNAFGGPTVAATLMSVSSDEPVSIRELAPQVPEALEAIVMRCLAKKPEERYQSAAELGDALAPFDEEESQAVQWPRAALLVSGAHPITQLAEKPGAEQPEVDEPLATTRDWNAKSSPRFGVRSGLVLLAAIALGAWSVARLTGSSEPAVEAPDPGARTDAPLDEPDEPDEPEAILSATGGRTSESTSPDAPNEVEPADSTAGGTSTDAGRALEANDDSGAYDASDASDDSARSAGPSRPARPADAEDPQGTARSGRYVAITRRTPKGDHAAARKYCEGLASIGYLGIEGWALANPAITTSFGGVAGIPAGRYWTSARWRGRAVVIALPSGRKSSIDAERGGFRPLCVAKFP